MMTGMTMKVMMSKECGWRVEMTAGRVREACAGSLQRMVVMRMVVMRMVVRFVDSQGGGHQVR